MKQNIRYIGLALVCTLLLCTGTASAAELKVGSDQTYTTISSAISAASSGDTIIVADGTYSGGFSIYKSDIIIRSENGSENTTISSSSSSYNAITIRANNVTIDGFNITGASGSSKAGIYIGTTSRSSYSDCLITNNTLTGNYYGIYLYYGPNNNNLINNTVSGNTNYGIYLYYLDTDNNNLINNTVSGNGGGIYCGWADNTNLTGNNVNNNTNYGIFLASSSGNNLSENTMSSNLYNLRIDGASTHDIDLSNLVDDKPVYYLYDSSNVVIPSDAGMVFAINSNNITVKDMEFSNEYCAVTFYGTINSTVENLTVSNCTYGIYLSNSDNNNVTSNNASYNGNSADTNYYDSGIYLYYSNNNNVTSNNVSYNSNGIYLRYSDNNNVTSNNMSYNGETVDDATDPYSGIYLSSSDANNLTDNVVDNNHFGIQIHDSGSNNLTNNTMLSNTYNFHITGTASNDIDFTNLVDGKPVYYLVDGSDKIVPSYVGVVYVTNSNNITVKDIDVVNGYCGVYFYSTTNSTIENVTNSYCYHGIYLSSSSNYNNLTGNALYNNTYGTYVYSSSNYNNLTGSTTYDNTYGTYLRSSDNNNLTGSAAYNNTYGTYVSSSDNNNLTDNTVYNNTNGIYVSSSNNNTFTDNTVSSNNYGFYLLSSSIYNTFDNNTVNENSYGIAFSGASKNSIINNTVYYNNHGLWIRSDSSYNTIMGNNVTNSTVYGIYLYDTCNYNNLTNNNASNAGATGIYLNEECNYNNLTNNNASNTAGQGILLEGSSYNRLINNIANNNANYGIQFKSYWYSYIASSTIRYQYVFSTYNTLVGNIANDNLECGIYLESATDNNLTNNNASNTTGHGILLEGSSDNEFINNIANNNTLCGIRFASYTYYDYNSWSDQYRYSRYNTLSNNTASNNTYGIYLDSANYNTFTEDRAIGNQEADLYAESSYRCELDKFILSNVSTQISTVLDYSTLYLRGTEANSSNLSYRTNSNGYVDIKKSSSSMPISLFYNDSGVNSFDESTMNIYGQDDDGNWTEITGSTLNTTENSVSGTLSGLSSLEFTTFGLFYGVDPSNILYVHETMSSGNYTSIQEAVDNAIDGNIIIVSDGTYYENVNITTGNITILSVNGSQNTIVQAASGGHGFNITANNVTIDGFNITGATGSEYAGIYLESNSNCTISNSTFTGNYYGIYLKSSNNNTFTDNTAIYNTDSALGTESSSNNTIDSLTITNSSTQLFTVLDSSTISINGTETNSNEFPDYINFNGYMDIENSDGSMNITLFYNDSTITYSDEARMKLYKFDSGNWEKITNVTYERTNNFVSANLTGLSSSATSFGLFYEELSYSGGSGTIDDPYLLSNESDIDDLSLTPEDWGMNFTVTCDITLTDNHTPIGNDSTKFTGDFNGSGHSIKNLTIYQESDYAGFFGYTNGANIYDLGIETSSDGVNSNSSYVGGLVGYTYHGNISNCYVIGKVNASGSQFVGGLIGSNGALLGSGSTVTNSYFSGNVTAISNNVGGLIGRSSGNVSNSYANANVSGSNYVGGLIGGNGNAVNNCFATGTVIATSSNPLVYGLVGTGSGSLTNCYYSGNMDDSHGTPTFFYNFTRYEFISGSSDLNWDENITTSNDSSFVWKIIDGYTLPYFQWQSTPAPLAPYIEIISPGSGLNNTENSTAFWINATGYCFNNTTYPVMNLTMDGQNPITGHINKINHTAINATFNLTKAIEGDWTLYVINPDGQTSIAKTFTVESPVTPEVPEGLSNTTGNFWVNYSWDADNSGTTDSYNISYNGSWENGTTNNFNHTELSAHAWSNITVYAYNATDCTLSEGVRDNVSIPNNNVTILNVTDIATIEGAKISFDINYTDADNDTVLFGCNYTSLFDKFDNATGEVSWDIGFKEEGTYYVEFNVSDGYGSIDSKVMTITVEPMPSPVKFSNTTGNFWVNHSWTIGTGAVIDSYNVSYNNTWANGTTNYFNHTEGLSAHSWSNVTVHAYNATYSVLSEGVRDNVSIPNNKVSILNVTDIATIEGASITFDINYTDADDDKVLFGCNQTLLFDKFSNATGEVSWDIGFKEAGTYYVEFNVTDSHGSLDSKVMAITVEPMPSPENLANDTGNFWVNHSWTIGTGAVIDSYNVSYNGSWDNSTTNTYYNHTGLSAHAWSNITVYAYNATYSVLSPEVNANVQIPNNDISILNVTNITTSEGASITFDINYTDVDRDTAVFGCNYTSLFDKFNPNTGEGSWAIGFKEAGTYYVEFNVSDGYGSLDSKVMTITVEPMPSPENLANNTGNFWVNHSWTIDTGTVIDSYNVSYNGSWDNSTTNTYYNHTGLSAHSWSNVTVYAYNATYSVLSEGVSDGVQIPNNDISILNVTDITTSEGASITFDINYTDADNDAVLFGCNYSSLFDKFNPNTGEGSWAIGFKEAGTYYLEFNVSDGYGSLDSQVMTITVEPMPSPENLANNTGNFWVNHSWTIGTGAVIDSYNVSYNGIWDNSTINNYYNHTDLSAHEWSNVTVHAYNATYSVLSEGVSDNVSIPNNEIHILNVTNITTSEGESISFDINFTDADDDTAIFGCNQSSLFDDFNTSTGEGSWDVGFSDSGTHYIEFNVSDEYGSVASHVMKITVVNTPIIHVGKGEGYDFSIIQDAVNDSSEGTTIIVADGTYNEKVVVDKSITLRSENGAEYTIVNGTDPAEILPHKINVEGVFRVTADNVTIDGFSIMGTRYGPDEEENAAIYLHHNSNCTISNNILIGNYYAIYLFESNNNTLSGNNGSSNDVGISLDNSNNNTLRNNVANDNDFIGIIMTSSDNNVLTNNVAMNNSMYDILAFDSKINNEINNLKITENNAQISFLLNESQIAIKGNATNSTSLSGKVNVNGYFTIERSGLMDNSVGTAIKKEEPTPINITVSYDDSGMSNSVESSIDLYRYNGTVNESRWVAVSNTSLNTSSNQVIVAITEGTFGLFRNPEQSSGSSQGSSSSNGGGFAIKDTSQEDTSQDRTTTTTLSTNSDGETIHDTVVKSSDLLSTLTLYKGTKGTDSSGNPVKKITISIPKSMPENTPKSVLESGLYYDYGPSGATFSEDVMITIRFDPDEYKDRNPTIYTYNEEDGWIALETTIDWENGIATAYTNHFSIYALFGDDVKEGQALAESSTLVEEVLVEQSTESVYLYWILGIIIILGLGIVVVNKQKKED